MKLPSVKDLPVARKKVLLRTNYDVPLRLTGVRSGQAAQVASETRIRESLPTINYLLKQKAKVIIASHLGRPGGKSEAGLSLKPIAECLSGFLNRKVNLVKQISLNNQEILILENLRFWPGEEANSLEFAERLAGLADFYVNDAFACSHRNHASIVGVPKFFPAPPAGDRAFGFDFLKEVQVLAKIREKPQRPVVLILGGVKKDKVEAAKKLISWADWILIGGKIVEYDGVPVLLGHHKITGSLLKNEEDITMETVKEFEKIIRQGRTIVWSGPLGNIYEKKYQAGTKAIAQAVVKSGAYSVIGGGDTEMALSEFGLTDKVNFISSGGGAMLAYLTKGTLPGIEAVIGNG